jgi:carbamoyltransferase
MRILGISPLDNDATASLYIDGAWHSIAEERLSRVKMHVGFPARAVDELLRRTGTRPEQIDEVVYAFQPWWVEGWLMWSGYLRDLGFTLTNGDPWGAKLRHLYQYAKWSSFATIFHRRHHQDLVSNLRRLGLEKKLTRVDHHTAHAASAYYSSGFDEALAVTLDWYGGGLAGSISRCTAKGIERVHEFQYPHSVGLLYGQVTKALGFKASRHEGKILGLAAYGDPALLKDEVLDRFRRSPGDFRYRSGMDLRFVNDLVARHPREQVAAAYQAVLEQLVTEVTAHWCKQTGVPDVVLAGGVAANVKMNQRIAELDGVRRVFIHPNMADGGLCVGATMAVLSDRGQIRPAAWKTCYLGSRFSDAEMEEALRAAGLQARRVADVPEEVARLLADGKIVARFDGAMEYGPRALGNRSILVAATDPTVNDWLNKWLGRTEFMPFAPVTLYEHRNERYVNIDKYQEALRFMTITCDCTPAMKKDSPAAVHVDGTARPQVIRREDNETYYRILEAYHRITGIPTLINTSFNMHEEPIVCTPADAIRAFQLGHLDYLSMGPFLVASAASAQDLPREARQPLAEQAVGESRTGAVR